MRIKNYTTLANGQKRSDYIHVCFRIFGDTEETIREASVWFPRAITEETIVDLHETLADGLAVDIPERFQDSMFVSKRLKPQITIISWQRYECEEEPKGDNK